MLKGQCVLLLPPPPSQWHWVKIGYGTYTSLWGLVLGSVCQLVWRPVWTIAHEDIVGDCGLRMAFESLSAADNRSWAL